MIATHAIADGRITLHRIAVLGIACGLALNLSGRADAVAVPNPFACMYGHGDGANAAFGRFTPPFNVIEGTSADANYVKELRNSGKVYAAHVVNVAGESATQLYNRWSGPFNNTLGGALPGGYDAVAIDELFIAGTNGTADAAAVASALQQLRQNYPNKQIFVAAPVNFGTTPGKYTQQLNAVNQYADRLMLECYLSESSPSYTRFRDCADNLKSAVPGILSKTVYGLGISQNGYVYDDSASVGFWGHLDEQFHRIRNDSDARTTPGIMAWTYYRSETDLTPNYLAKLVDHYFVQGKTSYFGDGSTSQLVANPQFESSMTGWTTATGAGGTVARFNYNSVSVPAYHDDAGDASHGTYGLKTVRGTAPNEVSYTFTGLDTTMVYTASAWVTVATNDPNQNQSAAVKIKTTNGIVIASEQANDVGSAQWNQWSRIAFNFVPTSSTLKLVLSDAPTAQGGALYWDFVELEAAYVVPEPGTLTLVIVGGFTVIGMSWARRRSRRGAGQPPGDDLSSRPIAGDHAPALFQ